MKKYNQSPLPFQGQKRRFIKLFREQIKQYSDDYVFLDLFGGSGLLSHNVKYVFPKAKVIYNDFDNFKQRLNSIKNTNKILAELRGVLKNYPRETKITGERKDAILSILNDADREGYVDYITLSVNLKYSMSYGTRLEDFLNDTLYNNVRLSDYNADGYLDGVRIVSMDYKQLYNEYKDAEKVVLLVDPPYLSTDVSTYSGKYWKLIDYLDVVNVLQNKNYFYFTSNKSQIVELCEWIGSVSPVANPFHGAVENRLNAKLTKGVQYTDIMYHRKAQTPKQKEFKNKEINIRKIKKDYEKIQRLDEKRFAKAC